MLGEGEHVWVIMGRVKPKLTSTVFAIVNTIYEAWKEGRRVSYAELRRVNGDFSQRLKALAKSDRDWKAIIGFPSAGRTGYGFVEPR
jgi:hypothetical protein